MRVALVSHYFPAHGGGIEAVAGELAGRLAAKGAEICWHASDCDSPPEEMQGVRCSPARAWNVSERRLGFSYPLWSPAALRALRRSVRSCDVVHVHEALYQPSIVACLAAALHARPVIVTQHVGQVPFRSPLLRGALAAANRTVVAPLLGRASRAVFVSAAVRDYFANHVRFREAPMHIPNGVDATLFAPRLVQARAAQPTVVFVGRFVEKKGLSTVRAIAQALPETRVVLAGWGGLEPESWALPNVHVVRRPGRMALAELYRSADLLVLPSIGEGFPLVVQEAMSCGTPALVSEETAAGAPEASALLLSERVGTPDASERWIRRVHNLLAAPDTLLALRPRVAAFAREHWSWERCAERYGTLLRDCVMEKHSSSALGKQSADRPPR